MAAPDKPNGMFPGDPRRSHAPRHCPICGKAAMRAAYPFCSKRCADVDLNRWLSGSYAIPAAEGDAGPDMTVPSDGEHED